MTLYSNSQLQDMSMTGGNIAESIALAASATSANGIGRVYTATSLPSHIWSFNGEHTYHLGRSHQVMVSDL